MNANVEKIFEKIYAENTDGLFRFVIYRTSDKETAIDIVADAYLKFWQVLMKEPVKEPRALLFKIARNLIIDWYKKKKSIPVPLFSVETEHPLTRPKEIYMDMFESDISGVEISSEAEIVKKAISKLDPIYREVVYLRFVEELSPKEIAQILGESTNTISVRINRGVKKLQEKLDI